jgi:hypothetical protein
VPAFSADQFPISETDCLSVSQGWAQRRPDEYLGGWCRLVICLAA